jgi:predicted NAD/FAD-dependent oxidoreductase
MQDPDATFRFIGDNMAKGISAQPALTFHANNEFSLAHFDDDLSAIETALLAAAQPWLGDAHVVSSQPKKWRFSIPQRTWHEPCWVSPEGTLVLAGDAFAGPKMEGAALSGIAAGVAVS